MFLQVIDVSSSAKVDGICETEPTGKHQHCADSEL